RIAREVAGERAWVAGSMGPTNVSLSMPTGHTQTFDSLTEAYLTQATALIDGGVDLLLIETVFDPINAKAAALACRRAMQICGREVPVMVSATLTETGGLLSGQSLEAFVIAMEHVRPLILGLNCGFGADLMMKHLPRLTSTPYYISAHANAGLPDEMGHYRETPQHMASHVAEMLSKGLVNIVGGCCGTTPEHIAAIAEIAAGATPRHPLPDTSTDLQLSGNEPMRRSEFIKVGERCNVAGSRKFLRLINEGAIDQAVEIAAGQIAAGAAVIDVNMDDGMINARAEMKRFVSALSTDVRTSAVPVMIDSSDMNVITDALKCLPGRSIVNSISLKEGEETFLNHARTIRDLGAAVVVMAFDEHGQATTLERRREICGRAYRLLTEQVGFRGRDIVFDPNVLTIATGIPEHDRYALDFLEATEWIRANLPGAKVSGGISNLSFAFRGHNRLREAMHSLFISHARERGMELAIVNPSTPISAEGLPSDLRDAIDDVFFCRRPDATERLMEAATVLDDAKAAPKPSAQTETQPTLDELIVKGATDGMEQLIASELDRRGSAMAVVSEVLMTGMNRVGELFGSGKMFLPQVVKSAGAMKRAVEILTPRIEAESGNVDAKAISGPVMVLATVKGDVHDIGKNIVAVVMRCSGFRVVDLGVMVPPEDIIAAARREKADCIGLSGLITPSLAEMAEVARMMESEG
ncbi:MAG: dihydropteroate synthase, partial [Muribaculaceae bacterium]|nr:dihydropteroate synthase [Muribaculaceae bacterium]